MTLRNFSLVFSASASHPPIHPRLAVLSFISLVIDINDTEQQDTTVFFHPRSGACFFTDQCPVSSILIRLYIVYPWGQMESLYTRTHTHTRQSSLIPCFIYCLELNTHDLAPAGWYSVCATTFCVSVYVLVEACNKVSMWPPAFRLVEPINLPLYSNTAHLWPSHMPIHIFFAGTLALHTFAQ